jgi:dTMP kinase
VLSAEERLEQLEKLFEELEELSDHTPVIVEGARDVAALKRMGITKNVVALHKGVSIFSFCEDLSRRSSAAVVLTDWDRRGGMLARMLRNGLKANGVEVNDYIRTRIVILSKKEIKDIESLPTFIERLRSM